MGNIALEHEECSRFWMGGNIPSKFLWAANTFIIVQYQKYISLYMKFAIQMRGQDPLNGIHHVILTPTRCERSWTDLGG